MAFRHSSLKGRLSTKKKFFVSNDTMKGPESRKKILNYENLCHCENTPIMHIQIREKVALHDDQKSKPVSVGCTNIGIIWYCCTAFQSNSSERSAFRLTSGFLVNQPILTSSPRTC